MVASLFLQLLVFLALGAAVPYAGHRLRERAPGRRWPDEYFNYLLFFNVSAFVYRFVPHVIEAALRDAAKFATTYHLLAVFLALPLSLLYLLFFGRFVVALDGRTVPAGIQRAYLLVSAAI